MVHNFCGNKYFKTVVRLNNEHTYHRNIHDVALQNFCWKHSMKNTKIARK